MQRQGAKNALVCGIGLLVAQCILAAAVAVIFGQPVLRSFGISWVAIYGATELQIAAVWIYGQIARGRVLLDCGPHPKRNLFLGWAVLFLVMGLVFGSAEIREWMEGQAISVSSMFGICLLLCVPSALFLPSGRLQVREGGIWAYCGLLRWDKIGSYRWADDATLWVRRRGRFSRQGAVTVPPQHKQAFEEQLAKHCPTQAPA